MIVWGLDTACDRLSVAAFNAETRELLDVISTGHLGVPEEPERRLGLLLTEATVKLSALGDTYTPALIAVETPRGGRKGQHVLLAGWGVATAVAGKIANRYGSAITAIEISTWRKRLNMHELAYQAGMKQPIQTHQWKALAAQVAKQAGYTGTNVDERDAVCIALAACQLADQT